MPDYICPQCKSSDVSKASLVYEKESKATNSATLAGGIGSVGGAFAKAGGIAISKGSINSLLGKRIAPPIKPVNRAGCSTSLVSLISFASIISMTLEGFIIGIFLGGGAYFIFKKSNADYKNLLLKYEEDLRKWNLNWTCNRCGHVFISE